MTLIVTEVSDAGIAMVADSAITYRNANGSFSQKESRWLKLLHVPSISAGVSYWGCIGEVAKHRRFDEWLSDRIKRTDRYSNIHMLADYLADEMNAACGRKPLGPNLCVGVHVAGFAPWSDGVERPFFYHVHNGHGHTEVEHLLDMTQQHITQVKYRWVSEPRKLFQKHQDFPRENTSLDDNKAVLVNGYYTQNGDYFIYMHIDRVLNNLFAYMNLIDGCRIPRNVTNVKSRMAVLKLKLETIVQIYRCSSMHPVIGGEIKCLCISPTKLFGN